ncbi:energy-coupling factor transport system ATP-binding protein [Natronobacillus azotifigens]|uniref:Energy-coupling factor transporter ATPase n=1 Tax=Natronobacillus azotifigens TaxID=472978 RepID=A0A9J6RFV7_9BACI|nr:energy-coupling factor transporter ATPase [Natronobacillus azotifigens]MCZ0704488.1 energy-coupling factor transporter ATPase [Natronobacillus azotifigens]
MTAQIQLEGVTFQYPGTETAVLHDVSLTIEKGTFLAIMGSNGSGKSTLCKLLNGLIPHYYVGDFSGKVTVKGLDTRESKVAELSHNVGYVYQDFENQLVSPRVLEDASFAPLNFGYADFQSRGKRALDLVGLHGLDQEFIWQLSGGQKHLLALAGALSLDPDILIIDEPVAQLDPQHAEEIYSILRRLNEEFGKTIIVIEHHTEFIAEFCKEVILMDQGQVISKKPTKEALQHVEELIASQIYPPQVTQAAFQVGKGYAINLPVTLPEACGFFSNDSLRENRREIDIDFGVQPVDRLPLIEMEQVAFSYKTITRSKKRVLKEVDLTINRGDHIALVGNNGAGKSSLMRLITGLVKPETGKVIVDGINTRDVSPEHLADFITYVYQNPEQMFIEDSVRKDVGFFLKARKVTDYQKKVDQILEQFDLTDLQDRDSRLMSGGQQRRASLAIGVAMDPKVILLDEPTANLDIATRKHITKLIAQLKRQVGAVVIATHDMQLVAEWANRIIVLHEGEIIHDGDRKSVFGNTALLERAGLKAPQIFQLSQALHIKPYTYSVAEFVAAWREKVETDGIYE